MFAELGRIIRDDGTDSDGDHLSDCEEANGMLATTSFYLAPESGAGWTEDDGLILTDPTLADSDGDDLLDGEEMLGLDLGEPLDLRDFPALSYEYAFLVEAGITRYYANHADPRIDDTDADGLPDFGELHGTEWPEPQGAIYRTSAVRWDTDGDGASDWMEHQLGTDPLTRQPNELGIPGLPRFTRFQPEGGRDIESVVDYRWLVVDGQLALIDYNRTPVVYDDAFNCVANCEEIEALAQQDAQSGWKCLFVDCTSAAERERAIIETAVATQGIFNKDGDFRGEYAAEQGHADCLTGHADHSQCEAPTGVDDTASGDGGDAFDFARDHALNLALGNTQYEPRDLCGDAGTPGGVYHLVEVVRDQFSDVVIERIVKYVGHTNDFKRREAQHKRDPIRGQYEFDEVHRAPDREVRRGLEQRLYNDAWGDVSYQEAQGQGSTNRKRPMSKLNPRYDDRMRLVDRYLEECLP